MVTSQAAVETIVFEHFVQSRDYNGIHLIELFNKSKLSENQFLLTVKNLIQSNVLSLQSAGLSDNPHIIRFGHYDVELQLQQLEENPENICVYPSQSYLQSYRDVSGFDKEPFTQQLSLGDPQLKIVYFELNVLERYFYDPRYVFEFQDYSGKIHLSSEFYDSDEMFEKDKVFLETFGLGYYKSNKRVIAAFIRYLGRLSSEHQLFWNSKIINGDCKMVKEYYDNTILGNWTSSYSVYTGFIEEIKLINILSEKIGKPKFFNNNFEDDRPKEFTFFLSPTKKNYEQFIHVLDKMLSDNINRDFFEGDIELFEIRDLGNGLGERIQKGTIRLLEEWLRFSLVNQDKEELKKFISHFKKVRSERNKPAHSIRPDQYDEEYDQRQSEIMMKMYNCLYNLRLILSEHPNVKDFAVPKWLDKGNMKPF